MHLRLHWEHQSELRVSQSVMASGPGGRGRGVCTGEERKKKKKSLGKRKGRRRRDRKKKFQEPPRKVESMNAQSIK